MASLTNLSTLYLLRSLRGIVCWPGPKQKLRTVRKLPTEPSRLSVPDTLRLCWTVQATAAGHHCHCGRCKPQSHGPSLRQREVGGSVRQEQSPCRSSRESCSHEASGQAYCQSALAIRSPERAGNLLAGALGHAARQNPHEIRTQTSRRLHNLHSIGHYDATIRRASRIPSNFGRLRPDHFAFCSGSETSTI